MSLTIRQAISLKNTSVLRGNIMEMKVHARESPHEFKVLLFPKKRRALVTTENCQNCLNQVVLLSLSENGIYSIKPGENGHVWGFQAKKKKIKSRFKTSWFGLFKLN